MNGQDLTDQPEGRQNHDVNRRVRVKPEQVLINNNIAPEGGIEKSCVGNDVEAQKHQCARQNRR